MGSVISACGSWAHRTECETPPSNVADCEVPEIPEALYESGKSQLSVRVPKDPGQRFPAVVRAADVLLSVTREAAESAEAEIVEAA